jgi:hypothetical protein
MSSGFVGAFAVLSAVAVAGCGGCGSTSTSGSTSQPASARSTEDAPVLHAGEERTFPAGQLAPGSTIVCVSGGIRAEAQVPEPGGNESTSGYGWTKDANAAINVDVLSSGDVRASCE